MTGDHDLDSPSDESLIQLYQREPLSVPGREALSRLIARWSQRIYAWAYRFVGEREQALDLAQDCLLSMIQALPRYQARGKFSAWLFTIVHNRCLDVVRRRALERVDLDLDALPAGEPGPEALAEIESDRERIFSAMREHLAPVEQRALWLRAYEGASVEHITRMLNLQGASGARGVLQSARRKLRVALGSDIETRGDEP
jgi:RNA polymerase sigma-70 factor (ECF subfamily)